MNTTIFEAFLSRIENNNDIFKIKYFDNFLKHYKELSLDLDFLFNVRQQLSESRFVLFTFRACDVASAISSCAVAVHIKVFYIFRQ